uniref:Alpha-ketoglutarate-dependent dioxygenase AlkB-like domain-containing protein n=1 Tax=Panagrolaimus sp. ES5 TaxID=591445 RepID=A0AC34GXD4_9BILA
MVRLSLIRFNKLIYFHNIPKWPPNILKDITANCTVILDFITKNEEDELLKEIEPHMKRLKYEKSHWDDFSVLLTMFRLSLIRFNKLIYFHNTPKWPPNILKDITANCTVIPDFITKNEEDELLKEIEPHMKRLKYEKSHWDDAIYLYREREQRKWSEKNTETLSRIAEASFSPETIHLSYIHILDLHKDGHIKPHTDSIRYCGDTISGVSLLSDSVMRLRHKDEKEIYIVDLWLKRKSLYKLTGIGRYDFTHEILAQEDSKFNGIEIPKDRRISVICRDMPQKEKAPDELEYKPLVVENNVN